MSFGFLVVVIGTDYMREIQLCPLVLFTGVGDNTFVYMITITS
jgi:hypothetical protein